MQIIIIFFLLLYILISFWIKKYKKDLRNKNVWFIRNGWENGRWLWPISWKGHLLWFLFFLPIPLTIYFINTISLTDGLKSLYSSLSIMITIGIYLFARFFKSEGILLKNDKWYDTLMNSNYNTNTKVSPIVKIGLVIFCIMCLWGIIVSM